MAAIVAIRAQSISRLLPASAVAAVLMLASGQPAAAQTPPAVPGTAQATAGDDQQLETVTVEAERAKQRQQISAFVSAIAVAPFQDSLKRWHSPVCPMVAGLPRPQGEFILEKISQIAQQAGVPLAPERCRANLDIVVTSRPEELLRAWSRRDVNLLLGEGASRTRHFIDDARPIRVWYNSQLVTVDGSPFTEFQDVAGGIPNNTHARGSRIVFDDVRALTAVLIIVDTKQVKGVTYDQLASYIGMVGLAELHADARIGDTLTVLQLFARPQSAPAGGLSTWDKAYLKALYRTQQSDKMQLLEMKTSMVSDLGAGTAKAP